MKTKIIIRMITMMLVLLLSFVTLPAFTYIYSTREDIIRIAKANEFFCNL